VVRTRGASRRSVILPALLAIVPPPAARADVIVSMNDGHSVLDAQGNLAAAPETRDTMAVINVTDDTLRIRATVSMPGSVVGPPAAVWVNARRSRPL
jgi:hypothetical protein